MTHTWQSPEAKLESIPGIGGSTGFIQQLCGSAGLSGVAFMTVPSGSTPSFSAERVILRLVISQATREERDLSLHWWKKHITFGRRMRRALLFSFRRFFGDSSIVVSWVSVVASIIAGCQAASGAGVWLPIWAMSIYGLGPRRTVQTFTIFALYCDRVSLTRMHAGEAYKLCHSPPPILLGVRG